MGTVLNRLRDLVKEENQANKESHAEILRKLDELRDELIKVGEVANNNKGEIEGIKTSLGDIRKCLRRTIVISIICFAAVLILIAFGAQAT